jgi:hypothetical protein
MNYVSRTNLKPKNLELSYLLLALCIQFYKFQVQKVFYDCGSEINVPSWL